ncbi:IS4 family transposase, partial [Danxiaibacter flavus]|uniref:IS4 family transposase n=1 Tax=Danxiaibacter flavus TaxID=3049108 RepID=UPI0034E06CB7
MNTLIDDEQFINRNRNGEREFVRNCKLTFKNLIVLLSKGLTRSLQRELNSFFAEVQEADYSVFEVTKSALTHARRKLKPEAFKELNQEALRTFYEEAPWLNWRGHRLLACDGSTMVLPRHPTTEEEFGVHEFGSKADSENCIARISLLYDVLNLTTLDSQLGKYITSERELLENHLAQTTFKNQDLLLLDRGYAGIALMHELQQKGVDFCMRLTDNWWKAIREMIEKGEKDKLVTFKLPAQYRKQMELKGIPA